MEWNDCILHYAKKHKECSVYGSSAPNSIQDNLSMLVPTDDGIILFQKEVYAQGKGYYEHPCAMIKLHLNKSYELSVKRQNLLRKGWDHMTNEYIKFDQKELMDRYSVRSNYPEYTKLALSEDEWINFMLDQQELNVNVRPVEFQSLDHTIKVYYQERVFDVMFSNPKTRGIEIQVMLECCRKTAWALNRYTITEQEKSLE